MLDDRSTAKRAASPILHWFQLTTPRRRESEDEMINLLTQARRFVLSVRGFFGSLAYRPTTTQRRSMNG